MFNLLLTLLLSFAHAQSPVVTDLVRLRPTAVPATCRNGDLRVDSGASNVLKICRSNAWTKLLESAAVVNADINASAAIAYSKLNLANSILNADVNTAAAIAYSKLNLALSVVNADIGTGAAIARSKVAVGTASHVLINDGAGLVSSEATLAITRGGTGAATANAAYTLLSPGTGKGDIVTSNGTSAIRVGVGADATVMTADATQAGGVKWATVASAPSASAELSNCSVATSVSSNALTVALKDAGGSDASAGSPCRIGFRSATAATGTYTQVSVTAALSVVISSGSTLGCTSAIACTVYIYAINNAGTVVLGASQGRLDQGSVQTSTAEGGAGAADLNSGFYSTAAQSAKAVRLIARVTISEATAGTWASNATEVANVPFVPSDLSARKYASTTSLTTTVTADITFNTTDWDPAGMISGATVTAPIAGRYCYTAQLQVGSTWTAGGNAQIWVEKNGSGALLYGYYLLRIDGSVSTGRTIKSSDCLSMAATDTLKVRANLDGTSPGITASSNNSFAIWRVGD